MCPKCRKFFNKVWMKGSKFNLLTWNDEYSFYKCKRCGHKWMKKTERLYVDCTSTTYYDEIPQEILDKLEVLK